LIVVGILGFLTICWLLGRTGSREQSAAIPKLKKVDIGSGPPVVIVTVIDPKADAVWVKRIKQNRIEYATRHGLCHLAPLSHAPWD
jgi:mannan polymerase II complex MNN11 subunit